MPSLNTVIKQASRGADLYFVFRFLRLLTMKYEKTDAYKYGIIDKKGKPLKRSSDLESVDEKAAYTMLHRLVFKVRRLIEKVPVLGKSILLNYAAALFLLKEQNDTRIWTDERYMGRKLMEFLENGGWEKDAELLREELKNQYGSETNEFLIERKMTSGEIDKREKIVLSLKKKEDEFKKKYGDDWKSVMYATATKGAMGEEEEVDEAFRGKITVPQINSYLRGLSRLMTNKELEDHLKQYFNLKKIKFDGSFSKVLAIEEREMKNFTEFQEDSKMGKQSDDQLRKLHKTASAKDQSSPANKSFTNRIEKEMKKRGILEDTASIHTKRERIRKQREKMGIAKKKPVSAKKEKDSPIRRAAKKAGMSRSDRKGLYNEMDPRDHVEEKDGKFVVVAPSGKIVYTSDDKKDAEDWAIKNHDDLMKESTAEYAKSLEKIANDKKMKMISQSERKTLKKIADLLNKEKNEDAPVNSVAGGGVNLDPHIKKKKKKELDESVKLETFAGKQVFVVDSDTYHQCRLGKKQYARYEKYVGKDNVGLAIREYGLKFPKRPIILQNGENGPMLFLRYGRS